MHPHIFSGHILPSEQVIFAVDDEPADRLLLARLLEQLGPEYPCRFFSSGEEIMNALLQVLRGSAAPLACFIDIKMTGISGIDVLRWIRCQDALDAVPVIMLSSSADPQKRDEACGSGAQCYVKKFPSAAELRTIITEAQRYSVDRSTPPAFHLLCDLPLNLSNAAPHPEVA